jgi:hypothetical protein
MPRRWKAIALGLLILSLAGCGAGKQRDGENAGEGAGEGPQTDPALAYWLSERLGIPDTPDNRDRARRELQRREALRLTARRLGVIDDPRYQAMRDDLLIARLKELHLQPRLDEVTVSEEEIAAYYEARKDQFQSPELRQLAVLWFENPSSEERRAALLDRLRTARDLAASDPGLQPPDTGFGLLSIDFSAHRPSRLKGGLVGWVPARPEDSWRRALAGIGYSLDSRGSFSEVVVLPEGLFLVRLVEIRPARSQPLDAASSRIHDQLLREKKAKLEESILREWIPDGP